ncbi:MAG: hypothetical protein ACREXR_23935, partial [Gammaproteobacteria bacterium]
LLAWFKKNLPDIKIEPLAQPEASGCLSGAINGCIRVAFTPQALEIFCARWKRRKESQWMGGFSVMGFIIKLGTKRRDFYRLRC